MHNCSAPRRCTRTEEAKHEHEWCQGGAARGTKAEGAEQEVGHTKGWCGAERGQRVVQRGRGGELKWKVQSGRAKRRCRAGREGAKGE